MPQKTQGAVSDKSLQTGSAARPQADIAAAAQAAAARINDDTVAAARAAAARIEVAARARDVAT